MSDLGFTVNAVLPIILLVAVGYILKRIKFITPSGAKEMNKLVFRVFLPATLFLNVYKITDAAQIKLGYILYVCVTVLVVFFLSLASFCLLFKDKRRIGALTQAAFRSNYALIGIPLATSVFGETGAIYATLLSAFAIPLFNVLAVVALSIFSGEGKERVSIGKILIGIVKNPLIISIAAGGIALAIRALLVRCGADFRLTDVKPVYKVLEQLAAVSTPLALVVLGANFEFSAVAGMNRSMTAESSVVD